MPLDNPILDEMISFAGSNAWDLNLSYIYIYVSVMLRNAISTPLYRKFSGALTH